jgi:chaperonin GroEL
MEKLQERLAKIVGGVAVINVGGGTEIEMKEKKDRLDDALQATKAALEEGILPGTGVALLHAKESITYSNKDSNDFNLGKKIIYTACSAPFRQILSNAGEDVLGYIMDISKKSSKTLVPSIEDKKLVDAFDKGIIDPTKVVRNALQNAANAAVTILMTECIIHDKPEDKKNTDNMMDGLGM